MRRMSSLVTPQGWTSDFHSGIDGSVAQVME